MTPIEALVQIAQSAALNPAASVDGLGRLARLTLRESGTHGLLYVGVGLSHRTVYCWCGWNQPITGGLAAADEIIATHTAGFEVPA